MKKKLDMTEESIRKFERLLRQEEREPSTVDNYWCGKCKLLIADYSELML